MLRSVASTIFFAWGWQSNPAPIYPELKQALMKKIVPIHAIEFYALLVTIGMVILCLIFPTAMQQCSPYLLLLGMVFPGIPHGAIDQHLNMRRQQTPYFLFLFIIQYLFLMALVFLIWKWQVWLGFSLFILYSSWHFGETDFRRLNSFRPVAAFLSGFSLLMFILSSHPAEFLSYMRLFGLEVGGLPPYFFFSVAILCLLTFCLLGFQNITDRRWEFICVVLVLVISVRLPLLLSFGIYFILIHSWTSWLDIKRGLRATNGQLLLKALPFSIGAFIFFAAFIISGHDKELLSPSYMSSFFIALSCISAPHVLFMARFYREVSPTQSGFEN